MTRPPANAATTFSAVPATDAIRVRAGRLGVRVDPGLWHDLPGGKRNRSWYVPAPVGAVVVKVFRPDQSSAAFPNSAPAEAAALKALRGQKIAPDPVASDLDTDPPMVVYRHIAGATGWPDPQAFGSLLRRLHAMPPPPGLRPAPGASEGLRAEIHAMLRGVADQDLSRIGALMPCQPVAPWPRQVFLHGDPVPGNVIGSDAGPRLIDWQCPAAGDPVHDLAIHLSPGMAQAYGFPLPDASYRDALLNAYADPEITQRYRRLEPFYAGWLAAYCSLRAREGEPGYAAAADLELARLGQVAG